MVKEKTRVVRAASRLEGRRKLRSMD